MNLDDLKVIRSNELSSRKLTKLDPHFYDEVKTYLNLLRGSKEQQKKDELANAFRVIEAVYDKRVAKIIRLASLKAKGHEEEAPLTIEELKIYEGIYQIFTNYRDLMLGCQGVNVKNEQYLERMTKDDQAVHGIEGFVPPISRDDKPDIELNEISKLNLEGEDKEREDGAISTPPRELDYELDNKRTLIQERGNIKYIIVRILADIPTFVGLDGRDYKLSKEDVVALPEGNASTLCNRQVAIRIGDLN